MNCSISIYCVYVDVVMYYMSYYIHFTFGSLCNRFLYIEVGRWDTINHLSFASSKPALPIYLTRLPSIEKPSNNNWTKKPLAYRENNVIVCLCVTHRSEIFVNIVF